MSKSAAQVRVRTLLVFLYVFVFSRFYFYLRVAMAESPNEPAAEAEQVDTKSSGPPSEQERKGMQFIAEAEKKVKSASSFLGGLLG